MTNEDLMEQIESLRKMMVSVGISKGFTATETVSLSKKLDDLLNQWVLSS
jgi:hypothetical protein